MNFVPAFCFLLTSPPPTQNLIENIISELRTCFEIYFQDIGRKHQSKWFFVSVSAGFL